MSTHFEYSCGLSGLCTAIHLSPAGQGMGTEPVLTTLVLVSWYDLYSLHVET
jgi:hypothetical protein